VASDGTTAGAPEAARSNTNFASSANSSGLIAFMEAPKDELEEARALIDGRGVELFTTRGDLEVNEAEKDAWTFGIDGIDMPNLLSFFSQGFGGFLLLPLPLPLPLLLPTLMAAVENSEFRSAGGRFFESTGPPTGASISVAPSSSINSCMWSQWFLTCPLPSLPTQRLAYNRLTVIGPAQPNERKLAWGGPA